MKVYRRISFTSKQHIKILQALKEDLKKMLSHCHLDPSFPEFRDKENQFFLRNEDQIFWGRVYFESFTKKHIELLKIEAECLRQTFGQPVSAHIFFCQTGLETQDMLDYPGAVYFRFFPAESGIEDSLIVEKIIGQSASDVPAPREIPGLETPPDPMEPYRFSRHSALSREELGELIDLSIDLKL